MNDVQSGAVSLLLEKFRLQHEKAMASVVEDSQAQEQIGSAVSGDVYSRGRLAISRFVEDHVIGGWHRGTPARQTIENVWKMAGQGEVRRGPS